MKLAQIKGTSQNNREMEFAKKLKILDLGQYQSNAIHARVSACLKKVKGTVKLKVWRKRAILAIF